MRSDRACIRNHLSILHCVYLGILPHSSTGYHEPRYYPALVCLG